MANECTWMSVGAFGVMLTAMAMAMLASVTVSMGDDTKGVFIVISLVSAEVRSC